MDIEFISEHAVSVYITKTELVERGFSPCDLRSDEALSLASEALGCSLAGAEIEMYTSCGDLLLFIERSDRNRGFLLFDSVDELISAVSRISPLPSSLWYYRGKYILALPLPPPSGILDYAKPFIRPAAFSGHLNEHGKALIRGNAVSVIQKTFLR